MKVEIQSVVNKGNLERERLVLKVLLGTDIGDYVVFCAAHSEGSLTTDIRNAFWFPDKVVSKGDSVVVYTKSGIDKERMRRDGSKLHFFYWGLDNSIWRQTDHAPVLLHAPEWETLDPQETD